MAENNKALAERFHVTTEELIQLIEKFDHASYNRRPEDGGWNAGEVSEHLLLFDIRLNEALETATVVVDRNETEKVSAYTPRVTGTTKLDAPPFLVPTVAERSPSEMAEKLKIQRQKVMNAIGVQDLSLVSTAFPHRIFGEMTAHEWVIFIDMHTHRHLPQLRALYTT